MLSIGTIRGYTGDTRHLESTLGTIPPLYLGDDGVLVGILSDSHGQYLAVREAVALFDRLGTSHLIHCGDVGGIKVFDELVGRPLTFVWGNTDFPTHGLLAYLDSADVSVPSGVPTVVERDEKRFAVFHGHEPGFDQAIESLDVDYLLHGHSHIARDEYHRSKRIINPGALHRAATKTVATLDTTTDTLTFHEIDV